MPYEAIFVGYSHTSKAYKFFNRSTMTIEESIHIKFEESNALVKNIIKINFLCEDIEKISLKDSPMQEEDNQRMNMVKFKKLKWTNSSTSKGLEKCYKPSQEAHHR